MTTGSDCDEWLAAYVTRTRVAQGLPARVEDEAVIDRVATILRTVEDDERRNVA